MSEPLEHLYQEARAALKSCDYVRASDLLRQILQVDENYKDTSRLLAQAVRLRRRRWYNRPLLWASFILIVLVALGYWIAPRLTSLATRPIPTTPVPTTPTATLIVTATVTNTPTTIPTPTSLPTSTSIPLTWRRLSMLQELPRDKITAIAVNPKDPDVIYIGTENAGIFKSIDSGISWQPADMGLANASITSLAINPSDPNKLYAGIRTGDVYKTTNGGASWLASSDGIDGAGSGELPENSIILSPQSPDNLYVFHRGHTVFHSTDGGSSWSNLRNSCQANINSFIISPINNEILFAGFNSSNLCQRGVYRSMDGGNSWELVFQIPSTLQNLPGLENITSGFSISDDGQEILLDIKQGDSYISVDGGSNWRNLLNAVNCMINPEKGSIILCYGITGLLRSQDAGISFHMLTPIFNIGWGSNFVISFKPGSEDTIFIGGMGFYKSTDAGYSWTKISNGLGGSQMELAIPPSMTTRLYVGLTGMDQGQGLKVIDKLYYSKDAGKNWDPIISPENAYGGNAYGFALDADGNTLYRLNPNGSVLFLTDLIRSNNDGRTWVSLSIPYSLSIRNIIGNPFSLGNLYAVAFDHKTDIDYLLYSQDSGATWKKVDMPSELSFDSLVFASKDEIYLLEDKRPVSSFSNISANLRKCWVEEIPSSAIATDPQDAGHLYLGTRGGGVYSSLDGCLTWTQINTGLGSLFINTVAVDPNNPDIIYAGTDGGAYVSFNGGHTWGQLNDGLLGATVVYSIVVDKDGKVFAATPYGVFKLEGI